MVYYLSFSGNSNLKFDNFKTQNRNDLKVNTILRKERIIIVIIKTLTNLDDYNSCSNGTVGTANNKKIKNLDDYNSCSDGTVGTANNNKKKLKSGRLQ